MLEEQFIDNLRKMLQIKQKSFSINFIISGDFTEKEKIEYISKIKSSVCYYIDNNNVAKQFLQEKIGTSRTPLFMLLDFEGEMIYWQHFKPRADYYDYSIMYKKLLLILEIIL